ncbi:ABC transporter ATP-binding protein [Glaesserella sp.]|uniref:ABC transporter ATP-binding protein n=1 Tax=Glaesserella sp. TaxID=2094731 RepID=UPI0035A0B94C
MLQISDLHFRYNNAIPLLNGIHLTLQKGEQLTILGANGTGKSTLLNCIAGILPFKQGQILLNNQPVANLSPKQIAQHIAYVAQHSPQTYQYQVLDYVLLGRASHLGMFSKPQEQDYALAEQALDKLGIRHFADKIYMHMSGGEKQLVNLAKILVQQPQLILFDEPTSALDYGNVFKTLSLIKELSQQGFSIIMTTHNPDHPMLLDEVLSQSRVAILTQQGKLNVGSTQEILTEENLKALYQTELRLIDVPELQRKICAITHI